MKKINHYKCTLLSDVILTSMANTEGYKESLNYISGSKFLGIVAKKAHQLYDETNTQKTLDIFHNGTVHFGDATPMIEDNTSLKVPFSWFHEKGKKLTDGISLHHKIDKPTTQLKQAREGYFSIKNNAFATVEQDFSIKSAYDGVKRKSLDANIYGYFSLKKGTSWVFTVEDTSGLYADEIKGILVGKHTIGKSKSAEYGLVDIVEFVSEETEAKPEDYTNEVLIYAQSNLCFYDNFGKTTALPTVEQLVGTTKAKILWEHSQVRSRNYQTWNVARNNRDTDRLIIESGSVFFIKLDESVNASYFENGIGNHRSEGFGAIKVNPSFLMSETETLSLNLNKVDLAFKQGYAYGGNIGDDLVILCLEKRANRNSLDYEIDKLVNQFKSDNDKVFRDISNSQWSALRNYAKHAATKDRFQILVFSKDFGFLQRGKSENEWRTNGRREKLEKYLNGLTDENQYIPFIMKLSNQMAKAK